MVKNAFLKRTADLDRQKPCNQIQAV